MDLIFISCLALYLLLGIVNLRDIVYFEHKLPSFVVFVRNHEPPKLYDIVHFKHKPVTLLLVFPKNLVLIQMYSFLVNP